MPSALLALLLQTLVARNQLQPAASGWYAGSPQFPAIPAQSCVERMIPAPGAAPGMAVAPGWPPTLPQGLHGIMYAGDQSVVVRLCNASASEVSLPSPSPVFSAVLAAR